MGWLGTRTGEECRWGSNFYVHTIWLPFTSIAGSAILSLLLLFQELIQMIKTTKIPIICICNDRQSMKVRSLASHCYDLRFQRPKVDQIKGAMMSVCFKEGLKIDPQALREMIIASGQDVRQVMHNLSLWSATNKQMNTEEVQKAAMYAKKNSKMVTNLFLSPSLSLSLSLSLSPLRLFLPLVTSRFCRVHLM